MNYKQLTIIITQLNSQRNVSPSCWPDKMNPEQGWYSVAMLAYLIQPLRVELKQAEDPEI